MNLREDKLNKKRLAKMAQIFPSVKPIVDKWLEVNEGWAVRFFLENYPPKFIMQCARPAWSSKTSWLASDSLAHKEFGQIRSVLTEGDLRTINTLYEKISRHFELQWKLAPLNKNGVIEYRLFFSK